MFAAIDEFARHYAVVQDAAFVIEVLEEQIQRRDALGESFLNVRPFLIRDDARQEVVWKNAFGSFRAPVHGECDALMEKRKVGDLLAAAEFAGREFAEGLIKVLVLRTSGAVRGDHLIVRVVEPVILKTEPEGRSA